MPAEMKAPESAASPTHIVSAFGHKLSPEYRTITNALITETRFDRDKGIYTGAVYDSTGALVIESLRPGSTIAPFRPVDPVSIDRKSFSADSTFPEAIYGGHYFFAWGHFLIETLSTAVMAPDLPDVPVLFPPWELSISNDWTEGFKKHVSPLLSAAGWMDREIIVSRQSARANKLHVPQRLTSFGVRTAGRTVHDGLATIFERIRAAHGGPCQNGLNVVAMRSGKHRRWHPSEGDVYSNLAERGYRAISPQNMSATEQIALFSAADTLVAFSGSGLHNSVFMHPGRRIIEIGDDESNTANAAQLDMCRVCNQAHRFVSGFDASPRSCASIVHDVLEASAMTP